VEVLKEARRYAADDSQSQSEAHNKVPSTTTTEQHRSILLRLTPLKEIEKDLKVFLRASSSETEANPKRIEDNEKIKFHLERNKVGFQEFSVRSSSGWKSVLEQIQNPQAGKDSQLHRVACHVVASCKDDIRWLWNDSVTQEILRNRNLRLEDSPGLYVNVVIFCPCLRNYTIAVFSRTLIVSLLWITSPQMKTLSVLGCEQRVFKSIISSWTSVSPGRDL